MMTDPIKPKRPHAGRPPIDPDGGPSVVKVHLTPAQRLWVRGQYGKLSAGVRACVAQAMAEFMLKNKAKK